MFSYKLFYIFITKIILVSRSDLWYNKLRKMFFFIPKYVYFNDGTEDTQILLQQKKLHIEYQGNKE